MTPSPLSTSNPRRRKTRSLRSACIPGLLLAAGLWAGAAAAAAERVDGVAAIVDDEVILLSEVDDAAGMLLARIQAQQGMDQIPPDVIQQARSEALEQLINLRVIQKFAERVDLAVTAEEIDETIAGIAAEEGVTPEQIYEAARREGLARDQYREELGNQITQMKVMSGAVRSRIEVPEEDVRALFEERFRNVKPGVRARVRQIFLPWPGEKDAVTRDQVRELAAALRDAAVRTGKFAELARENSRLPSAATGGLTTFREGEVSPEIAVWIFDPPLGSISPVIESDAGCNIFQVLERVDPSKIEYEQVADALRAELSERQMEPEFNRWIASQREQYYIEIVAPGLR